MAEENEGLASLLGNTLAGNNSVVPAGPGGEALSAAQQALQSVTQQSTQPTGSQVSGSGEVVSYSSASVPMGDFLYQNGIQPLPAGLYDNKVLKAGLDKVGLASKGSANSKYIINDHKSGASSILINSDRVIINSKASHTIIAGAEGVAITSPKKVNIDADDSVTLFAPEGVYLGVPNKGQQPGDYPPQKLASNAAFIKDGKKLKSYPTADAPYEPMVLGYKLINWLDDLLVVIKNMQILTNTGLATPREDAQWDFIALQTRLKELVSTYIYIDGYSHEIPDFDSLPKPPTEVTKPKTSIDVNATVNYQSVQSTPPPGVVTSPNSSKPGYFEGTDASTIQTTD